MKSQLLATCILVALAGCTEAPAYDPGVAAGDFVAQISNPYLPFTPGRTWHYELETPAGSETIDVEVLAETRMIMGVTATVVRDTVRLNGVLVEDTWDWYGQDRAGNVWYLGEDTVEYKDGVIVNNAGAWEWGVDGALPGIIMPADPNPDGRAYYQEYYLDEAEDEAEIIGRGHLVEHGNITSTDSVVTREFSRLAPGIEAVATYVAGIGLITKAESGGPDAGSIESLVTYHIP